MIRLQVLSVKYKAKKYKWIIYTCAGVVLLIIILFGSVMGTLEQNGCDDTSSVSVTANSASQKENAQTIYNFLVKNYGATPQGASGVLGNLQQESQLDPSSIERKNDDLSGHGLAQWTSGRATELMTFAKSKSKSWDNLGLQIEFLDSELKGSEKQAVKALKATSVEKATSEWQTLFERAGKPVMGNRLNYANKWFAEFGTSDPISANAQDNASNGAIEQLSLECSSSTDTTNTSSDIVKTAESMKGYFYYVQSHPSSDLGTDLKNPNKTGGTDCSGFVWLTLNKAGYKVPANMGWFTGSMASDAKGSHQYLKQISESEAKAGDIVIVNQGVGAGNNGHTAILLGNWQGKDTKIIQEGGDTSGHVNEGKFGTSFSTLLDGGDVVLARPVKK